MNKTNKKRTRRTLLIVFAVLIITLVSWNVMVLAADSTCPADVDLGNLGLWVTGWGAHQNTGYAEMHVSYPGITYITDNDSSYCGYPQWFTSVRMRGRGDSMDSVKTDLIGMALELSCNDIIFDGITFNELIASEGPIRVDGTIEIREDGIYREGELRYTVDGTCKSGKDCKVRKKVLLSCQESGVGAGRLKWLIKYAGVGPEINNFVLKLYNNFLASINNLDKNEVDDDFYEGAIDTFAGCCAGGTFPVECNENLDCNDIIYVGDRFCLGRHIAQNSTTPMCIDGGTTNAKCSGIDLSGIVEGIVEYCVPDQACQGAVCTSPTSCSGDDDGGMDYLTQGTVTTPIYNFTDDCENSRYLTEYGCQGSALVYERVDCMATSGQMCWDGVCGGILSGSIDVSDVLGYVYHPDSTESGIIEAFEQRETLIMDSEVS